MPALSPQYLFSIESNWRVIQEEEYAKVLAKLWYDKVCRVMPTGAGKEIVTWILSNASLDSTGMDPSVNYSPMTILEAEFVPEYFSKGLELQRAQFEDSRHPDGSGIDIGTAWVRQIGAQAAWYPQKITADLMINGTSGIGYDGVAFFSTAHNLSGRKVDPSVGTFANLFTGTAGAAGVPATDCAPALYPGAVDIRIGTGAVTGDSAFAGLQRAFQYIASIPSANNDTPRMLEPVATISGPDLWPYLQQLTDAKFISMSSKGGGGGTTDIAGLVEKMGYGAATLARELRKSPGVFYIVAEDIGASEMAGLVYLDREPLGIRYHTGEGGGSLYDSYLSENDTVKWIARGRSKGGYGFPYKLFRCSCT